MVDTTIVIAFFVLGVAAVGAANRSSPTDQNEYDFYVSFWRPNFVMVCHLDFI
jgi:hypothetical protein